MDPDQLAETSLGGNVTIFPNNQAPTTGVQNDDEMISIDSEITDDSVPGEQQLLSPEEHQTS